METKYQLPVSIIKNHRLIEPVVQIQGSCKCDFYYITDKNQEPLSSGPLCYIGTKNLISLNNR